ncbi:hypothetical protein EYF80_060117 [Liparis tanakae]|uniref:Uncharacterized protein n=1 Tax=Liparis tanakae TaxID=230148 RepID=A0A4Z2EMP6_9TELE|nr:hypothetical protein EYF80_060117 [Liparis tanakae]
MSRTEPVKKGSVTIALLSTVNLHCEISSGSRQRRTSLKLFRPKDLRGPEAHCLVPKTDGGNEPKHVEADGAEPMLIGDILLFDHPDQIDTQSHSVISGTADRAMLF